MPSKKTADSRIRIPGEIRDLIRGMHPVLKRKTKSALEIILSDPSCGKALKEELEGLFSYPVGRFRIIYRNTPDRIVEIVAIGPRRRIYEETYLVVKKEARKR